MCFCAFCTAVATAANFFAHAVDEWMSSSQASKSEKKRVVFNSLFVQGHFLPLILYYFSLCTRHIYAQFHAYVIFYDYDYLQERENVNYIFKFMS